jgi:hypothetical protein
MKEWNARKGRIEKILIIDVGLTGAIVAIRPLILFAIPIWIIFTKRLITSKIPKSIKIDHQNAELSVIFSSKSKLTLSFDELGFAVSNKFKSHIGLTIYKIFLGTRGQLVTKRITEIVGLNFTTSWKKNQVAEIIEELEKLGIVKTKAENRDLPLWERLLSN